MQSLCKKCKSIDLSHNTTIAPIFIGTDHYCNFCPMRHAILKEKEIQNATFIQMRQINEN